MPSRDLFAKITDYIS